MRRTLLAITAVLLATVGTTLLYVYVSTADNRAKAQIERVTVLVAAADAEAETPAAQLPVQRRQVASFDKVEGALSSLDGVQGQVLGMKVLRGQQIVPAMFAPPTVGGLPKGHLAISVQFGEAQRVATLIKAGSIVDIYQLGAGRPRLVLGLAKVLSVQPNGIVTFDLDGHGPAQQLLSAAGGQLVLEINNGAGRPPAANADTNPSPES